MNLAPAELLHLLVHAALQPSSAIAARKRAATAKKNAGHKAGVGILFQKGQAIFRRKRRLARQDRAQRRLQVRAFRSSTVHSIRFYPFLAHRLSGSSSSWAAVQAFMHCTDIDTRGRINCHAVLDADEANRCRLSLVACRLSL
jgi:hypothetical protein